MERALTIEYFDSAIKKVVDLIKGVEIGLEGRFIERVDKGFTLLNTRLSGIDTRLMSVEKNLSGLTLTVGEIQDELHSVSRAVDKDAFTIIDHERRITRLETIKA